MKKVIFTKKYANKHKGEKGEYDSMLARQLINLKVAKYFTKKEEK